MAGLNNLKLLTDFFNKIGHEPTLHGDLIEHLSLWNRMTVPEWVVLIAGSTGSALRAVRPPNRHITPAVRRDLVQAARS